MLIKSAFARKLSLRIAIVSSVLLLSVLMTVATFEVSITVRNSASNLDKQLELCAANIDSKFEEIQILVDNIASIIDYLPTDSISYRKVLTDVLKSDSTFYDVYVLLNPKTALKTSLVCPVAERSLFGDSVTFKSAILPNWSRTAMRDLFETGVITAEYGPWYGPSFEPLPGIYLLGCAASSPAVKDGGGCVVGIDVSVNDLMESLKSMDLYPGSVTYVVDDKNHLVCDSEHEMPSPRKYFDKTSLDEYFQYYMESILHREFDIRAGVDSLTYDIELDEEGEIADKSLFLKYALSMHKIRLVRQITLNNGWSLYVTCPLKEVFSDSMKILSIMGFGILASIILLFIFCTRIIVIKARPLKHFANASRSIAKGDFDAELPSICSDDEVGQLRDAFEVMQVSLKQYIQDLKITTAEKERMASELNIASGIQLQTLRKDFPSSDRFDLYASMHAAKEVGGDLYDFVLNGNKLYICVGDVSGKGVPAALLMMTVTTLFRQICTTSEMTLSEVASMINNCVADGNDSFFFVTFFAACINLDTLEMNYCNCGHNQIVLIDSEGHACYNEAIPNKAFGIFENYRYVEEKVMLDKGCRVILYTDGVNEAKNKSREQYGYRRLLEWADSAACYKDEKSLVEGLLASVGVFADGAKQSDDITVLSVKIK